MEDLNTNQPKMTFNNTFKFQSQNLFSYTTPYFSCSQNPLSQSKIFEEKPFAKIDQKIKKKFSEKKMLRSFYVYYALKESAILALNYAMMNEMEEFEEMQRKLIDIFGEDLIQSLIPVENENVNNNILEINL